MTDLASLLSSAGVLSVGPLLFPDTPESRNCLLLGPAWVATPGANLPAFERKGNEFDTFLPVRQDPNLAFTVGGLGSADPGLRARAIAVPGPGCTIMGIARTILKKLNTAASATLGGPLTELELARGILAYNRDFLAFSGLPAPPLRPLPTWMAGMYLTLPLEFDRTNQAWITNFPTIRLWTGLLTVGDDAALGEGARALTLPDAGAVTTQVTALLAAFPNVLDLLKDYPIVGSGPGLRRQLLSNPFEVLFRMIEVLRQLRTLGPGSAPARRAEVIPFLLAFAQNVSPAILEPLAQTTAGNAILRQFQLALEDARLVAAASPDATRLKNARDVIATSMSQSSSTTSPTGWKSFREFGPYTVPQELPLTKSQEVRNQNDQSYLIANVFGYPLEISQAKTPDNGSAPSWNKLSFQGTIPALTWLAAHATDPDIDREISLPAPVPNPGSFPAIRIEQDKVRARAQLAVRISRAEGGFDSVQAGDNGLVSYGIQQWAAHVDEELTVLFERFRAIAPDQYDLYFGSAGLQTKRWILMPVVTNTAPVADPAAGAVDAANPYGPDLSALDPFDPAPATQQRLMDYFPFYTTFVEVLPARPAQNIPAGKFGAAVSERYAFIMKNGQFRLWGARARLAGLMSHAYRRAQIQQSVFRFTRVEQERKSRIFSPLLTAPFPVPSAAVSALSSALTAAATNMSVHEGDSSPFPRSTFLALCENELISCTRQGVGSFKIQRAQHGTAAAPHVNATDVSRVTEFAALSGGIDGVVTALPIRPFGFSYPGSEGIRLLCESEKMYCRFRTATTLTVQRGYEGTAAAPHADNTVLYRIEGDTVLKATITAAATSITVNDASFLPAAGAVLLRCGSEIMLCTAAAGDTLTVTRGAENTTAAAHTAGAVVYRLAGYAELFNSELMAATLLDIHINAPSIVIPAVYAAIRRTPGDTHAADGSLADPWLRRFGMNYLAARAYNPDGSSWLNAGTRNNAIIVLHDRRPAKLGDVEPGLSPDPGTFEGWKRSP